MASDNSVTYSFDFNWVKRKADYFVVNVPWKYLDKFRVTFIFSLSTRQ